MALAGGRLARERPVPAAQGSRVPVYRSTALSSMEAGLPWRPDLAAALRARWRAFYGVEIRTQSRRPINTQSWVLRRSAMLIASQIPIAVNATVKAIAAILASMR